MVLETWTNAVVYYQLIGDSKYCFGNGDLNEAIGVAGLTLECNGIFTINKRHNYGSLWEKKYLAVPLAFSLGRSH